MEVGGQRHVPAALPPGKRGGTHFTGCWVGPEAGLDGRKISSPPGFDPRTVQPVASRYTDWAIPAHNSSHSPPNYDTNLINLPANNDHYSTWCVRIRCSFQVCELFWTSIIKWNNIVYRAMSLNLFCIIEYYLTVWRLTTHIWVVPHR